MSMFNTLGDAGKIYREVAAQVDEESKTSQSESTKPPGLPPILGEIWDQGPQLQPALASGLTQEGETNDQGLPDLVNVRMAKTDGGEGPEKHSQGEDSRTSRDSGGDADPLKWAKAGVAAMVIAPTVGKVLGGAIANTFFGPAAIPAGQAVGELVGDSLDGVPTRTGVNVAEGGLKGFAKHQAKELAQRKAATLVKLAKTDGIQKLAARKADDLAAQSAKAGKKLSPEVKVQLKKDWAQKFAAKQYDEMAVAAAKRAVSKRAVAETKDRFETHATVGLDRQLDPNRAKFDTKTGSWVKSKAAPNQVRNMDDLRILYGENRVTIYTVPGKTLSKQQRATLKEVAKMSGIDEVKFSRPRLAKPGKGKKGKISSASASGKKSGSSSPKTDPGGGDNKPPKNPGVKAGSPDPEKDPEWLAKQRKLQEEGTSKSKVPAPSEQRTKQISQMKLSILAREDPASKEVIQSIPNYMSLPKAEKRSIEETIKAWEDVTKSADPGAVTRAQARLNDPKFNFHPYQTPIGTVESMDSVAGSRSTNGRRVFRLAVKDSSGNPVSKADGSQLYIYGVGDPHGKLHDTKFWKSIFPYFQLQSFQYGNKTLYVVDANSNPGNGKVLPFAPRASESTVA